MSSAEREQETLQQPVCAIALGSNLGDSETILTAALDTLDGLPDIAVAARSRIYKTAPVGPPQPDYCNCCALLQTTMPPLALMRQLLAVEQQFGRVRRERWGPRLLDIDLVLYGDFTMETPELTLPHPRFHERAFVLVPLSEIAPDWRHPILGKTVGELVKACDRTGIR
ncbi:MAG: 2-amino-4-hydroxy-6-hydroxymethyldihydropteridine diphosphokinase [Cyanobacteria bacterium P01_F01_bin.4]